MKTTHIPKTQGIYCIEHVESGTKYIGSSKNMYIRLNSHKYYLKKGRHSNPKLQNFFNKYGEESFVVSVVEETNDLVSRELFWINSFNCFSDLGFNFRNPDRHIPPQISEKTRNKMRESHKGEKNSFYGRNHSSETKEKIKSALAGKMSGPNNPFYGKTHSSQSKEKISKSNKGKPNPFKGRSWSEPELQESLSLMKNTLSIRMSGENNPQFGVRKTLDQRIKSGKIYRVTDPNGNIFTVQNLSLWCETNGHSFEQVRSSLKTKKKSRLGWFVELVQN